MGSSIGANLGCNIYPCSDAGWRRCNGGGAVRVTGSGVFERRLAESIARTIELDIIDGDLTAGTMIGSEADLMKRFQASRGVVREAVTILESHMFAETKRGVGGGLVVAEPHPSVVEDIVSLYLAKKRSTETELLEARLALETYALHRVMETMDDAVLKRLRQEMAFELGPEDDLGEASQRLHLLLGELSGNSVVQLFIGMMTTLVEELWTAPGEMTQRLRDRLWRHVCAEHNKIIEAMVNGDEELATEHLTTHLQNVMSQVAPRGRHVQASPLD